MSRTSILIISPLAFHENVGNAGAKTVNFYTTKFIEEGCFDITICYLGDNDSDYSKMISQFSKVKIYSVFATKGLILKSYDYFRFKFLYPFLKAFSPKYYITDNFAKERLVRGINNLKLAGLNPYMIIVEFPRIIYWIDEIKTVFPESKTVASCHDVTFQSVERYFQQKHSNKYFSKIYIDQYKKMEIKHLNSFDHVVILNEKDRLLLINEPTFSVKDTYVISPFYDSYQINPVIEKKDIMYFGALGRVENVQALRWFLENVWEKLDNLFLGALKFIVVGGGLNDVTKAEFSKYNNVVLKGFVKDPTTIFSGCFCSVVPLMLGAGIKIKVLDAMKSGIPVITNNVGIEGIPGVDGLHYLHAENAHDFYQQVVKLSNDKELQKKLALGARLMVIENFNYRTSYDFYKNQLLELANKYDYAN
ncbi:glycosyltransferase [Pedobacter sp. JCM 36344]|uniref:glycosyltransferase n=1 Tax=Pedobacter sp. JCM 36344 TaxID=3374280 RepID=UPI00397BD05A